MLSINTMEITALKLELLRKQIRENKNGITDTNKKLNLDTAAEVCNSLNSNSVDALLFHGFIQLPGKARVSKPRFRHYSAC